MHRSMTIIIGGAIALALTACASSGPSSSQLAESRAAIAAAQESGAEEHPSASLHLDMARDGYVKAKRLMEDGDGEQARLTLQRAYADAQLALALSHTAKTRTAAEQSAAEVSELQEQLDNRRR